MSRRKKSPSVEVVLTRRALEDLREIEQYSVKEWGDKTAQKYLDGFAAALDRIKENPRILRLEPDFGCNLYFYRMQKHFFVCDFYGKRVIVLTIIHTGMDLPSRLLELEPRLIAEAKLLQARLPEQSERQPGER